MKTNNEGIMNYFPAFARFLNGKLMILLLVLLMADCKKEEETQSYWDDKYYELDWDIQWGTEDDRFTGSVRECNIGVLEAKVEFQVYHDDDWEWNAKGTYNTGDVLELVPLEGPILDRSFNVHLTGTILYYDDGDICDIIMDVSVHYIVNVETKTGTLKWDGTVINYFEESCPWGGAGVTVPGGYIFYPDEPIGPWLDSACR